MKHHHIARYCPDYRFSYMGCCRDTGLSNYLIPTSDTLYLEATLNHTPNTLIPNSSANFDAAPLVNVCLNKDTRLSFGATDSNGDSLHYEIIRPQTSKDSFLNWAVGYSTNAPLQATNGLTFHPRWGIMHFIPAIEERVALKVKVSEYHYGAFFQTFFLIGTTTREIVINVTSACTSMPPASLFHPTQAGIDTSARFYCNDSIIKLKLAHEIQVDKIAKDGSNFRLIDTKNGIPIPIIETGVLNTVYSGLYTKEIWLKTFLPITRNDTFHLSLKQGLKGTALTHCL